MNFSQLDSLLGRQRCRQWEPLITQQLRLRHLNHIIGMNIAFPKRGKIYFTLHFTSMSAPFYTSEKISNPNPKWDEINLHHLTNSSASGIVIRIWLHQNGSEKDSIILTWGVNFSGLVYIGNKIAEIQPTSVHMNSLVFFMDGGYFTSPKTIKTELLASLPFYQHVNISTKDYKVFRYSNIRSSNEHVTRSYSIERLKRLHSLQIEIRNQCSNVNNIRDRIKGKCGLSESNGDHTPINPILPSSSSNNVRYAPQLLTMNSLNKMLEQKPTKLQKQEMIKINKEIEVYKFRNRLLSQERDKKLVAIRQLKQKQLQVVEENEEQNSRLMDNYHLLSKETEKLKEYKRSIVQHRELFVHINSQLEHRKKQLLQQLLHIYPIIQHSESKYLINGIFLPNSDILADCSDTGLSVALGYVTHILKMCSIILQVPLRYPLTHNGSRSYITDFISSVLSDKDRDFPLFTKGQDKMQFTYAVYLLNKNIAQFRWLFFIHTSDLKATLPNLLNLLNLRDYKQYYTSYQISEAKKFQHTAQVVQADGTSLITSLQNFGSNQNISDPILDSIRHENHLERGVSSPSTKSTKKKLKTVIKISTDCGPGLSEILAIPEAFLNKQISSDTFKNYIISSSAEKKIVTLESEAVGNEFSDVNKCNPEYDIDCDILETKRTNLNHSDSIEQGTDLLDPSLNLNLLENSTVKCEIDEEKNDIKTFESNSTKEAQQEYLKTWIKSTSEFGRSEESLYNEEVLCSTSPSTGSVLSFNSPLTDRTDALLSTKSFNLVRPKQ